MTGWRFPPEETSLYYKTDELLEVLSKRFPNSSNYRKREHANRNYASLRRFRFYARWTAFSCDFFPFGLARGRIAADRHRTPRAQLLLRRLRRTTRAAFPEGVNAPVQYGARIAAFVVYLLHFQLLPEARLVTLMADLFGVTLSAATIAAMSGVCATRLAGLVETIRDHVAGAKVKHMDETGFRIGGKTQWLHVACTVLLTFYRVCAKRGSLLSETVRVVGVIVHDHWKPYYTMEGVKHALCNAHHLRELKALVEIEKEDWAGKMQRLLRRACHAANLARERELPLNPRLIQCFERRYDAIVAEGLAFHEAQPCLATKGSQKRRGRTPRRAGHNLLLRFSTRKEDTLRFLHDPTVPFTNNEAERDGRMMKLRQKISGGFRSLDGASDFATTRSFIATAKKQGWKIIEALTADPENLAKSLRLS